MIMFRSNTLFPMFAAMLAIGPLVACSSDDDDAAGSGGTGGTTTTGGTGGSAHAGSGAEGGSGGNGGGGGKAFTPPADPGDGGFWITVSGEDLALLGYEWTSSSLADGDPPAFVDGWALRFDHVIVTIDKLRINADPDKDDGNPQDLGPVVAALDGPWAVDATIGGNVVGKSGSPDEKTVPIAAFATQDNGDAFDDDTRYAFGYDIVEASEDAKLVNLDASGRALYEQAKANGWSMILAGTATYEGPTPDDDSVFAKLPTSVNFTLGMKNPSSYVNCRNTDLNEVGGEFPRGVQANANRSTIVQITIHTDHVFWDRLNVEGTPLHFDAIAANASTYGSPDEPGTVTLEDLVDVDISGFRTKDDERLPARSLVSDYEAPNGQLRYDPNGTSFERANSLAAFLSYSAVSGGHMNADGECEIINNFTP
jgi:hypothetical protein